MPDGENSGLGRRPRRGGSGKGVAAGVAIVLLIAVCLGFLAVGCLISVGGGRIAGLTKYGRMADVSGGPVSGPQADTDG